MLIYLEYALAILTLLAFGAWLTVAIDRRRQERNKKHQRGRKIQWPLLLLCTLFLTGCESKTITGKLVSKTPTGQRDCECTLRFQDGREWTVTDNSSDPWPLGQNVQIDYEQRPCCALVRNVVPLDSNPPTSIQLHNPDGKVAPKEPTPTKKIMFSGQSRFGEIVIYETEYNHAYCDDLQVQMDNDSVVITRKKK